MTRITQEYVKDRFAGDTKDHTMEVLHDDGVYRHLKFTDNGSSVYRFDITTWPGHLCVSGDMGTYVFSRLHDMFDFFKMDKHDFNYKYVINPGYWGEKLQATNGDRGDSYKEFSYDLFKENVLQEYDNFVEQYEDEDEEALTESYSEDTQTYKQMLEELREAIDDEVLSCDNNDVRAYDAAAEFRWQSDDGSLKFDLGDFWEYNHTTYTFHYLWILYAIVWGINEYEKSTKEEAA